MSQNMVGKIVAVTGASSGIGEAIARRLASEGAKVVLGARRVERIEALAEALRESGAEAVAKRVDVTRRAEVEEFIAFVVERYQRIDVLINNAGVMPLSPLGAGRVQEWESMIDVNLKGVLYGIAAALPHFRRQNSGHLVNVSSVAGHSVFPSAAVYCATKFAVRAVSEGFRQESGPTIRSTIISPGAVQSELAQSISHQETAEQMEGLVGLAIEADAIARAVSFAVAQPSEVDVNEILVRPTAQTL